MNGDDQNELEAPAESIDTLSTREAPKQGATSVAVIKEAGSSFSSIFMLGVFLTCVFGGIALGVWVNKHFLRGRYFSDSSQSVVNQKLKVLPVYFPSSDGKSLQVLVNLINQANEEVIIVANVLSAKSLVDAAANKARDGKKVIILLNISNKDSGPVQYMRQQGLSNIFFDSLPSGNQMILVDKKFTATGNIGFSTKAEKSTVGAMLVVEDEELAQQLREFIKQRLSTSTR